MFKPRIAFHALLTVIRFIDEPTWLRVQFQNILFNCDAVQKVINKMELSTNYLDR